jgi:hypothetical protein
MGLDCIFHWKEDTTNWNKTLERIEEIYRYADSLDKLPRTNVKILFISVIYRQDKQAKVFNPGKPFQPFLLVRPEAYPREGAGLMCL